MTPEGDILGGAPAFFYALSLKRFLGILRRLRRVAFKKQISDCLYTAIAKDRYKIQIKNGSTGSCCLHFSARENAGPLKRKTVRDEKKA